MNEPIEHMYFNWLCAKVVRTDNSTPSLSYDTLLRTLHNTEFVWLVSGDDNRAEDGVELRVEFLIAADIPDHPEWRNMGCSVLEMLIAFSYRAEFVTDQPAIYWFWEFMTNLGLNECNDASGISSDEISEALYVLVWRQYNPNGLGGLFPMNDPEHDQREVEIWYQFNEYLVELESNL